MSRAATKVAYCLAVALSTVALIPSAAHAQTAVLLPDTSQISLMTATVSEQARISVPAAVSFAVTNVGNSTNASAASVAVDRIALATATKQLKISVQAAASSFTAPVLGAVTWSAADISWNAGSWTRATGVAGTLSASAFTEIATCNPDAPDCSTTGLVFTLGAKSSVQRAGNHTLVVTWKVESIGS
jgi:hypothetical protein